MAFPSPRSSKLFPTAPLCQGGAIRWPSTPLQATFQEVTLLSQPSWLSWKPGGAVGWLCLVISSPAFLCPCHTYLFLHLVRKASSSLPGCQHSCLRELKALTFPRRPLQDQSSQGLERPLPPNLPLVLGNSRHSPEGGCSAASLAVLLEPFAICQHHAKNCPHGLSMGLRVTAREYWGS